MPIDAEMHNRQVNTCLLDSSGMHESMRQIDDVFKALADPVRRELLDRLHAKNGQMLSALGHGLEMTRQAVTQHLQILEAANLISVQWQGREKLHYFNPVPIHELYRRWIRKFEESRLDTLHDLKTTLEGEHHDQHSTRLRDLHLQQR
jgi:DNA-binding transcriptional ArsR family regulator